MRRCHVVCPARSYDFPSPWWDTISEPAKELVRKCLTVDPNKRYTAEDVLKHAWISNNNTKPIALDQLKKYNATRKLKKAANKLIAAQRAMSLVKAVGK